MFQTVELKIERGWNRIVGDCSGYNISLSGKIRPFNLRLVIH